MLRTKLFGLGLINMLRLTRQYIITVHSVSLYMNRKRNFANCIGTCLVVGQMYETASDETRHLN